MGNTIRARTARKPHKCEGCHWTASLRGKPTIALGHRYLLHTYFPGHEANTSTAPFSVRECVACAAGRGEEHQTDACGTFCCGDTPCARRIRHDGDHSCRRCAEMLAEPARATYDEQHLVVTNA